MIRRGYFYLKNMIEEGDSLMLEFIALLPHPPIAVKEVGRNETERISATVRAIESMAEEIRAADPDVVVAITPHGHVFSDAVTITALDKLAGDLADFGAPQVKIEFKLDREAANAIVQRCQENALSCAMLDRELLKHLGRSDKLDHGLVVPLSFLVKAGWQKKLVPVNTALFPYEELYNFGIIMSAALNDLDRKWVLLISGDMSHSLLPGAPGGYSPQGARFDEIIRQSLREGDVKRIFNIDRELIHDAAECGLRPLIMGLGALDGYEIGAEEFSYEGTFGVGYLIVKLQPGQKNDTRQICSDLFQARKEKLGRTRLKESLPVRIARESIAYYLSKGRYLQVPPDYKELEIKKAAVFVSLKKHGELRGCIGTIEPEYQNMGEEIIYNAVSAALRDPRFDPLQPEELDELEISVDVLGKPEAAAAISELDPAKYGVIVSKGSRRGLLLPDLPGIKDAHEQIEIAKQKAGIGRDEPVKLERFTVTRYK